MHRMFSWGWFVIGVLVSAVVAYVITETESQAPRIVRAAPPKAVVQDAPQATVPPSIRTSIAAIVPEVQVASTHLAPREVAVVKNELLALRLAGGRKPSQYRRLLSELLTQGDEGVAAAMELLGDSSFEIVLKGRVFRDVCAGLDDDRIFPAVVALLDEFRQSGWTSSSFSDGYYDMVAQHGGVDGVGYLLERIREDPMNGFARNALADVPEPIAVDLVLADLGTGSGFSEPDLIKALAGWNEPRLNERLTDMAFDQGLPTRQRESAMRGVLTHATDPVVAAALVGSIRDAASPSERALGLRGAYGLGENRHMNATFKTKLVVPLLVEGLLDPERRVRRAAMSSIGDFKIYRTAAVEAALEDLLARDWGDRESVELLLGRVRSDLY